MKIDNALVTNMFRLEISRSLTLRDMGLDLSPSLGHEDPRAACVAPVGTILELEMKAYGVICLV